MTKTRGCMPMSAPCPCPNVALHHALAPVGAAARLHEAHDHAAVELLEVDAKVARLKRESERRIAAWAEDASSADHTGSGPSGGGVDDGETSAADASKLSASA